MLAGRPEGDIHIPHSVLAYATGNKLDAVWRNDLGGLTFHLINGPGSKYIKWAPHESGLDLKAEQSRLEWAITYIRVPKVLEFGEDNEGSWLITEAINGENAVSERWKQDPTTAVIAVGKGLRAMHDSLPVDDCSFSWSTEDRISRAKARLISGKTDPKSLHPEFSNLAADEILKELNAPPVLDEKVVCHGDACAPNTLIDSKGDWAGHVDLGNLGVAERWADLTIAAWSTGWNYGPGWETLLYESYGIIPDAKRIRFYRLLWDLEG